MKLFSKIFFVCFLLISALGQAKDIFQAIKEDDRGFVFTWLNNNPNLEVRNEKGRTVLMQAALCQNEFFVRVFLDAGVNKYALDNFGKTAYELAQHVEDKIAKVESRRAMCIFMGAVVAFVAIVALCEYYSSDFKSSYSAKDVCTCPKHKYHHHYHHYSPWNAPAQVAGVASQLKISDLLK